MKKSHLSLTLIVILVGILWSLNVYAQHQHDAMSDQGQAAAAGKQTDNAEANTDPMQECQKHHADGTAALAQAETTLEQARSMTDPAQMKSAIETAQEQIGQAKHHFGMCPMNRSTGENHDHISGTHRGHEGMKCMDRDSQSE